MVTSSSAQENRTFLGNRNKELENNGCCKSKHTFNCFIAMAAIGGLFLLLGVVFLAVGEGFLRNVIRKKMALEPGSKRLQSWLTPPVQPHLTGYAFNVLNPDEVTKGGKPILQEVGPFVYKSVTVKDSRNNLEYNDDGETLTYSPRKFYHFEPSLSVGDPDKTFITVPNIPLITALSDIRGQSGIMTGVKRDLITKTGLGTLFINVSFSGLLWGYEDELPCLKITKPSECVKEDDSENSGTDDGENASEWDMDEEWRRRRKRSVEDIVEDDYDLWEKPKGGLVGCACNWGLFRDRNVTLREPVKMFHGLSDVSKKGWVKEFNDSPVLNWWKKGSQCDAVGGQDGGTIPPGLEKEDDLDIFISLMCRRIKLSYEKDVDYVENLVAHRYVPPPNAMGSHDDEDPVRRNVENECYCLKEEGFNCFKSGVLNLGPCKRAPERPLGAPLALSYPHFYQAHPDYLDAVVGLNPKKEDHEFFVDLAAELGFPLAIRPRFQLNIVIQQDKNTDLLKDVPEQLVLPFLWAQDGFDQPSMPMAQAIREGVDAPSKLSKLMGLILLVIGGVLLLSALGWFFWRRKTTT